MMVNGVENQSRGALDTPIGDLIAIAFFVAVPTVVHQAQLAAERAMRKFGCGWDLVLSAPQALSRIQVYTGVQNGVRQFCKLIPNCHVVVASPAVRYRVVVIFGVTTQNGTFEGRIVSFPIVAGPNNNKTTTTTITQR